MKVYLIRHSEPTYTQVNAAGLRGYGRELGQLTEHGIQIAQQRAHDPLFKDVQLLLSSPYTRTLQTGLEIVRFNDLPLKVELNLREWQPDVTGKRTDTDAEASAAYQVYQQYPNQRPSDAPLPYETVPELRARVLNVFKQYQTQGYQCIACVTHGELIHQLVPGGDLDFCDVRELTID